MRRPKTGPDRGADPADQNLLVHTVTIVTTEDEVIVRLYDDLGLRFGIRSPWTKGNHISLKNAILVSLAHVTDSVVAHVNVTQLEKNGNEATG